MFDTQKIKTAIAAIQQCEMVIIVDDESRENEGDLVLAAEHITPEKMNFLIKEARGLVCLPMVADMMDRLRLVPMVYNNQTARGTNFTISIEAAEGITTGISAKDRAATVLAAIADDASPCSIVSPGHIFPLRAADKGVLERDGHTEASVDLVRLAGLKPAAVICEIMNDDGTMARADDLKKFAKQHDLLTISVAELRAYRLATETWTEKVASATLPLAGLGEFLIHVYQDHVHNKDIVAIENPELSNNLPTVRLHSACFTGDILGSLRCDCGSQLKQALAKIYDQGGVLLYLDQEGRGIGLASKIKAYALQEQGMDTVEANLALGFKADLREYATAAMVLKQMGYQKINLLSNNSHKIAALEAAGIDVVSREALMVETNEHNVDYIKTKFSKLGHIH